MSKLSDFFKQFRRQHFCSVVVVAAGSSTRAGKDKLFALLNGVPVIAHTLKTLEDSACVDEIILVTREDKIAELAELCDKHDFCKVTKVICGGNTRTASAYIGVMEVSRKADLIAIHDGARPFVTHELMEQAIHNAVLYNAAAPAIPAKDTIRRVERDGTVSILPREELRLVQTPQIFQAELIKAALSMAIQRAVQYSDDCAAVEAVGARIKLFPGSEENIKITTPVDFALAEAILKSRRAE